jgi:hypothetical protein
VQPETAWSQPSSLVRSAATKERRSSIESVTLPFLREVLTVEDLERVRRVVRTL